MDRVSVPSVLASRGLVASNSFSMCFSDDGVGRINFGDAGSRSQAETPFIPKSTHPTYNVSFTTINVGSESAPVEFAAIMDSGTSFTYLNDPEYTALATNFNSQIRERRANFSSGSAGRFPFEYCYRLSPEQTEVELPVVSLTTRSSCSTTGPAAVPSATAWPSSRTTSHQHRRPELHDRAQSGVRQGEVRPGLAEIRLLQEHQSGRRTGREPQPRAGADDDAHAAAERREQQVPRRGARAAPAVGRLAPRRRRAPLAAPSAAGCCSPCLTPASGFFSSSFQPAAVDCGCVHIHI